MDKRECESCGEIREVFVVSSQFGPISTAHCKECLKTGRESYGVLVAAVASAGSLDEMRPEYKKEILRQLDLHKVTIETFEADIEESDRRMNEYFDAQETGGNKNPWESKDD